MELSILNRFECASAFLFFFAYGLVFVDVLSGDLKWCYVLFELFVDCGECVFVLVKMK